MKRKVEIDLVAHTFLKKGVDEKVVNAALQEILSQEEEQKEPSEKAEKQYVVVTKEGLDTCIVCQVPAQDSPDSAIQKLEKAREEFNDTKKGRRMPFENIFELAESNPRKFLVANNVWVKNKNVCYLINVPE